MSFPLSHLLRQVLFEEGLAMPPTPTALSPRWACYLTSMPDGDLIPNDAIAIYDTAGSKDGRLMAGKNIIHPAAQVKVRASKYTEGWAKIEAIATCFEEIRRRLVTVESVQFTLSNVSQVGSILPLGVEEGTKRRDLFTLNVIATLS